MKTFLVSVFAILAAYLLMPLYTAAVTAFIWVPIIMGHWSGIIIGVIITTIAEVLYYKFIGEN